MSYEEFLYSLLQKEYDIRHYNLIQSTIKSASFPYKRYLENLDISTLPKDAQNQLKSLSVLQFIKEGAGLLFINISPCQCWAH
ncbi:ATP-binding protein [Clostridium cibarium]|uniref:ATP-binding protein n=1 Tax=Clostridium cibarium TaxID=2762247 RepID=UPI003C2DCC35